MELGNVAGDRPVVPDTSARSPRSGRILVQRRRQREVDDHVRVREAAGGGHPNVNPARREPDETPASVPIAADPDG